METNYNFKSQICTSREQSERLLELGLKKETADCFLMLVGDLGGSDLYTIRFGAPYDGWTEDVIPAWSLARLIKDLMPQSIGHLELAVNDAFVGYYEDRCESEAGMYWEHTEESSNLYDNIISTIEWLIKNGYFNKEYLEG